MMRTLCALRQTCKYFFNAITVAKEKAIFESRGQESLLVQVIATGDQNSLERAKALCCFNIDTDKKIFDRYVRSVLQRKRSEKLLAIRSERHAKSQCKAIDESVDRILTMTDTFELDVSNAESGESVAELAKRVHELEPTCTRACVRLIIAGTIGMFVVGVGMGVLISVLVPGSH
jgi:hypothetical protein